MKESFHRKRYVCMLGCGVIWLKNVPTKEARLIGDILGHWQLGVGDWWYARRIEYYISQGRISVIQDSENKYARLISQPL